jgi:hypothetical protein
LRHLRCARSLKSSYGWRGALGGRKLQATEVEAPEALGHVQRVTVGVRLPRIEPAAIAQPVVSTTNGASGLMNAPVYGQNKV